MRSKWFAMMLAISLLLTGCTGGGDLSSAADDGGGSSQAAARTETEWGSTDAVLHTYDGKVQAATFCLTGDGERSPALEAGEFDTGFLEGLGALTPQTPPETVDWTQTGVELTITDDGEDYVYQVLLDGGLCTEQNGQTYWLGTDQPAFSFQRGVSGFIAAAEPRVERTELAWPEDEPDAWGTEPAGPLAVPEGSTLKLCVWNWEDQPLFLTLKDGERAEELTAALESVTETVPFELVTGGTIYYIAAETPKGTLYYMFRGTDELFDYQNQVIWKVPEGVFDQCLALYAQEMASQLN